MCRIEKSLSRKKMTTDFPNRHCRYLAQFIEIYTDMSRRRLRQTRQMPIVPAPSNASSKSLASSRSSRRGTEDPFVHFLSPLSPARPTVFEESPEEIISGNVQNNGKSWKKK
ncbi:hypothetical protein Anas_09519 [Armadillidium nasatum]|uniref:Uncharacterized protein n=1 Tax=Armadillidium nasatum TaxID=96803 RepID=A0A5N5SN26_9CRUS|nr:hypothetical protein Anas_09519 [Armadillidium nasatum]